MEEHKYQTSTNFNPNISSQISQTFGNNNPLYNSNYPYSMGASVQEIHNGNYNSIPQDQMIRNRNVFDHSVSSLGDVYQRILKKDNRKQIEDKFNDVIIENPLFYQMNEYEEQYGDMPQYEDEINAHFSKTQSNYRRAKTANVVNNIFLSADEIMGEGYKPAFHTNKQALYHKPEYKESKKYSFVTSGKINPPKSSFSIKQQCDESKENHKREMGKVVLHAQKITIKDTEPDPIGLAVYRRKPYQLRSNTQGNNVLNPKESIMVIGEGCKPKQKQGDNHVMFTQPVVNTFQRKSVSSRKARRTLHASEKLFSAVDDYFTSNEMKIPSKNKISDIVKFSQDMEKSLDNFNKDLKKRPATANSRYEDPIRKKLQIKKGIIKPKPKKVYPEIEDNYKRTVREKMTNLQIELRQIFDSITQIKESSGDEKKLNEMISKAKELTGMISHLAKDIKTKEEEFKQSMKKKKSISPKKTKGDNSITNSKASPSKGGSGVKKDIRPVSASGRNVSKGNVKTNVNKTSPTFPTFKDKQSKGNANVMNSTNVKGKRVNQKATMESIQKSSNFLRSTGFNPIIEEFHDLINSYNNIGNSSNNYNAYSVKNNPSQISNNPSSSIKIGSSQLTKSNVTIPKNQSQMKSSSYIK